MSDLINRVGRFSIPRDTLRGENNEDLFQLFGQTIILRAEYKLTKDVIEYTALSPLFRGEGRGGRHSRVPGGM